MAGFESSTVSETAPEPGGEMAGFEPPSFPAQSSGPISSTGRAGTPAKVAGFDSKEPVGGMAGFASYLGAATRFNDNQFPDSPYNPFDLAKFNAASEKPPADRTETEQTMVMARFTSLPNSNFAICVMRCENETSVTVHGDCLGGEGSGSLSGLDIEIVSLKVSNRVRFPPSRLPDPLPLM